MYIFNGPDMIMIDGKNVLHDTKNVEFISTENDLLLQFFMIGRRHIHILYIMRTRKYLLMVLLT